MPRKKQHLEIDLVDEHLALPGVFVAREIIKGMCIEPYPYYLINMVKQGHNIAKHNQRCSFGCFLDVFSKF